MNKASILTILGFIFLILKLCSVITWSWLAVLSPFIIEVALIVLGICSLINNSHKF